MGKKKPQQSNPPDDNDIDNSLAGCTLEDYFATHKVSGHVSQNLLNIPAEDDVMAAVDCKDVPDRKLDNEFEAIVEENDEVDEYEDDYESDTSTPKAESPSKVAGMTLSEYLHVKESDDTALQEIKSGKTFAAPGKIIISKHNASGLSLDLKYLETPRYVSDEHKSIEKKQAVRAAKKAPPKVKRKSKRREPVISQAKAAPKTRVKNSSHIDATNTNSSTQDLGSNTESRSASNPHLNLISLQRRQKRKSKAKPKQRRQADSESSGHVHHPSHHGSYLSTVNSQPPLPKLAASLSVSSLSHKAYDADENGDDMSEKLPPL